MVLAAIALTLSVATARAETAAGNNEPHGQVSGFYSTNGKLSHATPLSESGAGFLHLFLGRDRGWGSEGLIDLVTAAAGRVASEYPGGERLQIGDVAAEHGGPISGHGSHRNGLDIDVVYYRHDHREQKPGEADHFDELFVRHGKLSPNLDLERSWRLIELVLESGRLNRIFMDPVIKAAFCDAHARSGDATALQALRRLRPLGNHADHMHIRLTCPEPSSPACVRQEDVPAGTGCDDVFAEPDDGA
jgi:penicillin-insensitive murein endopeptidase